MQPWPIWRARENCNGARGADRLAPRAPLQLLRALLYRLLYQQSLKPDRGMQAGSSQEFPAFKVLPDDIRANHFPICPKKAEGRRTGDLIVLKERILVLCRDQQRELDIHFLIPGLCFLQHAAADEHKLNVAGSGFSGSLLKHGQTLPAGLAGRRNKDQHNSPAQVIGQRFCDSLQGLRAKIGSCCAHFQPNVYERLSRPVEPPDKRQGQQAIDQHYQPEQDRADHESCFQLDVPFSRAS